MADMRRKTRDAIIEIALRHKRFRFRNGRINSAALARELGMSAPQVYRLLRVTTYPARGGDYQPGGRLLDGLAHLTGGKNRADALEVILNAPDYGDMSELL